MPTSLRHPYVFDALPTKPQILALRAFLGGLPWPEYQLHWSRRSREVEARPIAGLTACKLPDRRTFLKQVEAFGKGRRHAGHFRSLTGRSRLIVPLRPSAHLGCFVKEASEDEFAGLVALVHDIVRRAPRHANVEVLTHGLDVGWLHIKVRPDPLSP